jgi:hypothetical protein
MWVPVCSVSHHWRTQFTSVVVYLPSTCNEAPPGALIQKDAFDWSIAGGELVVEPIVEERSSKPYRIALPEWTEEWLRSLQKAMPEVPFNVMGCSRGAAWGVKLLETSLPFRRAVLVCPYYQGYWKGCEAEVEMALEKRLQIDPTSINIVYGSADCWEAPTSLIGLVRNAGSANNVTELQGYSHEATLASKATFWVALTGP